MRLVEEKILAVCNACGADYAPAIDSSFVCPRCGEANARITAGNDIVLKTMVCQVEDHGTGG